MIRAISSFLSRLGIVSKKMVSEQPINILDPPAAVRGMTKWQPELFEKSVILPHVTLPSVNFANQKAGNILRKYKLSIPNFTNIFNVDGDKGTNTIVSEFSFINYLFLGWFAIEKSLNFKKLDKLDSRYV